MTHPTERTEPVPSEAAERERREGNQYLVSGAAVGAAGVASAALLGATCPLCVVAAPGFVGYGLYKRWCAARKEAAGDESTTTRGSA